MYRRNITHILTPLGLALALIIGYHLFLKPSFVTPPAPTDPKPAEPFEAVATPPTPPSSGPREGEIKQVRALDQTVIPDTPHEALLEAIRDEIEKRNLSLAETKLTELPPAALSNAKVKPFVAILLNNLALQQELLGGTLASVETFKKAAALDDSNPVILMNLAHAYWEQRDRALNQEFLTKLIRLAPDEPFPHLAMADLLQEQDQFAEAAKHLTQGTDRARQDPALQSYLTSVTARVRRTESAKAP